MSEAVLPLAMRLTWIIRPTGYPEDMQFSFHTGLRDLDDTDELFDVMETFAGGMSGLLAPANWVRLVQSVWATGPGFTGWHQSASQDYTVSVGGGDMLPHQLTVVVGYRNVTETSVALGRRRNRANIGPLRSTTMDSSGRTTTTVNSTLVDQVADLHTNLQGVPALIPPDVEFAGLVVASPTEAKCFPAEQSVIGRRYDILRSRAEHSPENPTYTTLEYI